MKRKLFTFTLITLLTACGGSGSSNDAPRKVNPSTQAPQVQNPNKNINEQVKEQKNTDNGSIAKPKPPVTQTEQTQSKPSPGDTNDKSSEGNRGSDENALKDDHSLELTIDIYEGIDAQYQDSDRIKKVRTETVKLSGSEVITYRNNYYFVPMDDFKTGYIGYFRVNENGANKNLVPQFVYNYNKGGEIKNKANLTGKFSQKKGVLYSPRNLSSNDSRQTIVKDGDITVEFKNGKANGFVSNPKNSTEKLFDIGGDVNGLRFTATGEDDQGGRSFGIPKGANADISESKVFEVNGKQYISGSFKGDKFHGVYFAKEEK